MWFCDGSSVENTSALSCYHGYKAFADLFVENAKNKLPFFVKCVTKKIKLTR